MLGSVLVLETSTETGSVAITRDGVLVSDLSFASRDATGARTEALAPAVVQCLGRATMPLREVSAVVCGAGPGGFTSLRSAAAFAKGICSALSIPLYAVSSLELLAWSAATSDGYLIAALQAGRGEWFCQDANRDGDRTELVGVTYLVGDDELRARAVRMHAQLIGPGLDMDARPLARALVPRLGDIAARGAVDLDSWEPTYGRLAEAQVKWEAAHGRPLTT
ncbi:MAG: tRNA (adenosine(37)-N6)-threonylcarbamoyltransferase complex dimerization subunit type 1 TsaB [Gemmatimonadota bacterium]